MSPTENIRVVVVGAGGLGREVAQYLRDAAIDCAGFLDDSPALQGLDVDGVRVLGRPSEHVFQAGERFLVAVGDPVTRRRLNGVLVGAGGRASSLVHPTACVSPRAKVGQGVLVGPFCFIGPGAAVADHSVLNTYASVGHDARVGQFCVLSPYAMLNGCATVADGVFLGSKAAVLSGVSVGHGSKVSAGSVVTTDVPPAALAAGSPARYRVMFAPWSISTEP